MSDEPFNVGLMWGTIITHADPFEPTLEFSADEGEPAEGHVLVNLRTDEKVQVMTVDPCTGSGEVPRDYRVQVGRGFGGTKPQLMAPGDLLEADGEYAPKSPDPRPT